jgi:2-oxoglutarate ferredoxin oxidoreductase subunit beta
MPLTKYEKLSEEEQLNIFPTGVLKHDENAREYCDMYEDIKAAQQKALGKHLVTQDQFEKKI